MGRLTAALYLLEVVYTDTLICNSKEFIFIFPTVAIAAAKLHFFLEIEKGTGERFLHHLSKDFC